MRRIGIVKKKVQEEIKKKAVHGRLSCPAARKIAEMFSIPYKEVGRAADEMKIKITDCELGCF